MEFRKTFLRQILLHKKQWKLVVAHNSRLNANLALFRLCKISSVKLEQSQFLKRDFCEPLIAIFLQCL